MSKKVNLVLVVIEVVIILAGIMHIVSLNNEIKDQGDIIFEKNFKIQCLESSVDDKSKRIKEQEKIIDELYENVYLKENGEEYHIAIEHEGKTIVYNGDGSLFDHHVTVFY